MRRGGKVKRFFEVKKKECGEIGTFAEANRGSDSGFFDNNINKIVGFVVQRGIYNVFDI